MNRNMNFDNCYKGNGSCPKAGIKIHETNNNPPSYSSFSYNPNIDFSNTNYNINNTNINNSKPPLHPKKSTDLYNTSLNELDLDINNYELADLFRLFNITDGDLNDASLKQAKQIVLKMHPDKSKLDSKYFLFFSKAYKQLFSIYEFQNKSITNKRTNNNDDFYDESNKRILDNMFEQNKALKDGPNFNRWFNESFEKHRINNPFEDGYGDWLKSNDDFLGIGENVTKSNMNEIFEQKKKQVQALQVYNGVVDSYSSNFGSSLGGDDAFTSSNYTDLRQAYTETLIPVTHEDYEKIPKYKNVNEYMARRDNMDTTPLSKAEAERILYQREKDESQRSAALAFKQAQEAEKAKQANNSFWGDIKRITGF